MKKILKRKNIYKKSVNNQTTKIFHKLFDKNHILIKGWVENLKELIPIYQEIENDFKQIDAVDLIFYERWLNE